MAAPQNVISRNKRNKWSIDFNSRIRADRQHQPIPDVAAPIGYSDRALADVTVHDTDSSLAVKKYWDVALGPLKQLPMNLFIMYMSGNSISIFPIMMVGMMVWRPIQALISIKTTFKILDPSPQTLIQKFVYFISNLLGIALALYKCSSMGLLPTHSSDWLSFLEPQQVDVFIPGCSSLPDSIRTEISDCHSYLAVKALPLAELTTADFIHRFVKNGQVYALSLGGNIDIDNVVAILPTGKLVLSLNKDTYEELGLEGRPSTFDKTRKAVKYYVEVDLTSKSFCEGKNYYKRIQWCFKDRLDLTFDFLLAWQPNDTNESLESIAAFVGAKFDCRTVPQQASSTVLRNLTIPVVDSLCLKPSGQGLEPVSNGSCQTDEGDHFKSCEASEVYEWLGAVACQCDCSGSNDGFVSTYECPNPSQTITSGFYQRWTGMITSEFLLKLINALRNLTMSDSTVPWLALTVHGFKDAPASWGEREHDSNLYSFIIFPKEQRYWLMMGNWDHNICP